MLEDERMLEQDIMERIRESAQTVKVPESLHPEQIEKMLKKSTGGGQKRYRKNPVAAASAAVVFLFTAGMCVFCINSPCCRTNTETVRYNAADQAYFPENGERPENGEQTGGASEAAIKKDAGGLYKVAGNYEAVYEVIAKQASDISMDESDSSGGTKAFDSMDNGNLKENGLAESVSDVVYQKELSADAKLKDFSETNLRMEGVDESDIVKTDGAYLYIVNGQKVNIISAKDGRMKETGTISAAPQQEAAEIRELFVDGNNLVLVVSGEDTELHGKSSAQGKSNSQLPVTNEDKAFYSDKEPGVHDLKKCWNINSQPYTELQIYEISDPAGPKLLGKVRQDGNYKTARKIGDIVYLFTDQNMTMPGLTKEEAGKPENAGSWIPLVNNVSVPAECIYVPEKGNQALVISSTDLKKPGKVVDRSVIMNNNVDIYVSGESLFIYSMDDQSPVVKTRIAKFSLKKGMINAVDAVSVDGEIRDTFAMDESYGKLRLLTTVWNGTDYENNLYLFDKKMQLTGTLYGIAEGEQIYAARFLGDQAYFVTYRNTDPLFSADLSDEKNPVITGELKVTGFSEYLHFWGKDKLVGIGFETDPDTGDQIGVKLCMFDLTDPADLKVINSVVIGNTDNCPALYDYKCVLADVKHNLLGFAAGDSSTPDQADYFLFSWEDQCFQKLMEHRLYYGEGLDQIRGICIGNTFYLVHPGEICSYNRQEGYSFIEKIML